MWSPGLSVGIIESRAKTDEPIETPFGVCGPRNRGVGTPRGKALWRKCTRHPLGQWTRPVSRPPDASNSVMPINQSINIRLLRYDKMQANNSKQKGNTVSKKKACLGYKPEN